MVYQSGLPQPPSPPMATLIEQCLIIDRPPIVVHFFFYSIPSRILLLLYHCCGFFLSPWLPSIYFFSPPPLMRTSITVYSNHYAIWQSEWKFKRMIDPFFGSKVAALGGCSSLLPQKRKLVSNCWAIVKMTTFIPLIRWIFPSFEQKGRKNWKITWVCQFSSWATQFEYQVVACMCVGVLDRSNMSSFSWRHLIQWVGGGRQEETH